MPHDENASISRRRFLRSVLAAGGGAAALAAGGLGTLTRLAHGSGGASDERFYAFAYFAGGWDLLLGLDPRDPEVFSDEVAGATRIQPGYGRQAQARFRQDPARTPEGILLGSAAAPLSSVSSRMAIVRGLSMDTLTHDVGRRRFLTGKPPSGLQARGSAGSAWLAAQFGGRLIPNLSVRVESFNPELPSDVSALRVTGAGDLVELLRRDEPLLDPEVDEAIAALHEEQARCAHAQSSPLLRAAETSRRRARAVLDAELHALFDFGVEPSVIEDADLRGKMELLHAHFDVSQRSQSQAALAGQALASGVARVVTFEAARGLDSHFDDWEDEHAANQLEGFEAIARLAAFLDAVPCGDGGQSMLDRTTIVAFSEFMRTPLLNARGGRDHWLTNACLMLGGNVRPGVIGASSDVGMQPQPVELASGRPMPGADEEEGRVEVLRPEHLLRTLLVDAGLEEDRADLRVPPIPALLRDRS